MRQRQQGMTFIGLLCILALAGVIVYAGIRLVPVYLNYMNVAQTHGGRGKRGARATIPIRGDTPFLGAALGRSTTISGIDYKDIEITKDEGGASMHVAYDDSGSLCRAMCPCRVHFEKTVKVR